MFILTSSMMAAAKRKLNAVESTVEKRLKVESTTTDFLRLNDGDFAESDYQDAFRTIADRLINEHELVLNNVNVFRLCELEFYFYQQVRHADTFAHRHPSQETPAIWYFHRQGTSPTASYKAGTYKGLDITFGSVSGSSYGGILIRSIQDQQTRQMYEGSCLVANVVLEQCQSETIKELVDVKLKNNLHVFNQNPFIYLRAGTATPRQELIASPRVGLTLKVPSVDRERFLFRPYRFTPKNYYPAKMKMTIVLALAAEKRLNGKKENFADYANELADETGTRLATVKANVEDFQAGYDMDIAKKSSPMIDFYKKAFTTSNLAKAYGIWQQKYRTS